MSELHQNQESETDYSGGTSPLEMSAPGDDLVLRDEDETRQNRGPRDEEEALHDPAGFAGPAQSHIETEYLSEDFLDGKVDLVEQMQRSVDALNDAYESPRGS